MKHSKRLKFQNNYSDKFDESDLLSMTICDNPKLGKVFKKINIKDKDIEKIKQWIILNKDTLLEYAEGNMSTSELGQKPTPEEQLEINKKVGVVPAHKLLCDSGSY